MVFREVKPVSVFRDLDQMSCLTQTANSLYLCFFVVLSPLIYLLLVAASIAFYWWSSRLHRHSCCGHFKCSFGTYQEGRGEQSLEALRRLSKWKQRNLTWRWRADHWSKRSCFGDILLECGWCGVLGGCMTLLKFPVLPLLKRHWLESHFLSSKNWKARVRYIACRPSK